VREGDQVREGVRSGNRASGGGLSRDWHGM
jgi:hypothetical protein